MSVSINWGKLAAQNRVKAPGIPWTEEELQAIHQRGMDPEDVRAGFLTPEDLEDEPKNDKEKLERQKKGDLVAKAKELGLDFNEKVVTKGDLIQEIKTAEAKLVRADKEDQKKKKEDAKKAASDKKKKSEGKDKGRGEKDTTDKAASEDKGRSAANRSR